MGAASQCLARARAFVGDHVEGQMIDAYLKHALCGDVADHIRAQELWMRAKGRSVDMNLGFIESYNDPAGTRGEFEGFVALKSQRKGRVYAAMAGRADYLLSLLPWPSALAVKSIPAMRTSLFLSLELSLYLSRYI